MDIRANLAIAVAPALLLLWLFKKWDEKRPEPPGAVRNVVIFGAITCLPAAGIEIGMSALLGKEIVEARGQFVNAFLIASATEELVKLAVVLIFLWRKPHFDEVMDGILYTAAASLGFALLENVLYSAGNPLTGMVRAFTAVPLHATCSGIMGYFVGRGKMSKGAAIPWIIGGYLVAVFIHGIYDWVVMSGATLGFDVIEPNPLLALGLVVLIVAICGVILRAMVKHALSMDDALLGPASRPMQPTAAPQWPAPPRHLPAAGLCVAAGLSHEHVPAARLRLATRLPAGATSVSADATSVSADATSVSADAATVSAAAAAAAGISSARFWQRRPERSGSVSVE